MSGSKHPNIIQIVMDDMGWRDLGSSFYETPCLERFGAEGIRFTNAYATSPVCSPSRASILTGRSPAKVGITNWIPGHDVGRVFTAPFLHQLPLEETCIASVLHEAGYQTWHVGKWHLGGEGFLPQNHGFQVNLGGCHWGHPHKGYWSPWGIEGLPEQPEGTYLTDHLTDEAIRLLRGRDASTPFFLNLWHYAMHTPVDAPLPLVEKYRRKAARLGLDKLTAVEEGEHFPCEHKRQELLQRRRIQSDPVYAAMMENLDRNIGRVLAAVDELGLAGDTIILFTSDHGGLSTAEGSPTCNAPLSEGKGWLYEGGLRVPLMIRWPGTIPAGTVCHTPVSGYDLFPTLLKTAEVTVPSSLVLDGENFLSGKIPQRSLFWHYPHYGNQGGAPAGAIRDGKWKLIEWYEDGKVELFNLEEDISESRDLSAQEPARVQSLLAALRKWRDESSAKMPTPNPDWKATP